MNSKVLLALLLQIIATLAVPLQMLQPSQGMQQQMLLQEANQQQILLQQLQRTTQQQMTYREQIPQQITLSAMPQVPLLQSLQGNIQQQRLALEEQLFALQRFQALQRMNLVPTSIPMNAPPILILFPNNEPDVEHTDLNINSLKYQKPEENGDDDTDIIDAEPTEEMKVKKNSMRAVLLMPNTRSFIGDFISSIPFLPIEINVPDSISWIYNRISDIISGIGQNLPFRPQTTNEDTPNEVINTKSIWNRIKQKQQVPIVMIPLTTI